MLHFIANIVDKTICLQRTSKLFTAMVNGDYVYIKKKLKINNYNIYRTYQFHPVR